MKKSLTHLAALAVLNPQRATRPPQLFGEISLPLGSPAPVYSRLYEQSKARLPYQLVTYQVGDGLPTPPAMERQISLETIRRAARNLRQQRGYSAMEIWWDESLGYQQREIPASEFYPQPSNPARDV